MFTLKSLIFLSRCASLSAESVFWRIYVRFLLSSSSVLDLSRPPIKRTRKMREDAEDAARAVNGSGEPKSLTKEEDDGVLTFFFFKLCFTFCFLGVCLLNVNVCFIFN